LCSWYMMATQQSGDSANWCIGAEVPATLGDQALEARCAASHLDACDWTRRGSAAHAAGRSRRVQPVPPSNTRQPLQLKGPVTASLRRVQGASVSRADDRLDCSATSPRRSRRAALTPSSALPSSRQSPVMKRSFQCRKDTPRGNVRGFRIAPGQANVTASVRTGHGWTAASSSAGAGRCF